MTVAKLLVAFDEILSIKQAVRQLPSAIDRLEREEARHFIVTRRNQPRAVLVSVSRYEQLLQLEAAA